MSTGTTDQIVLDAFTSVQAKNTEAPKKKTARHWRRLRFIPLAVAAMAMVLGLWSGLLRLGIPLPGRTFPASELHGAFMIAGFLGTLICLERAVALGRWWAYAAPAFSALGAVALIANAPHAAALAFIIASTIQLFATAIIAARQFAIFTIVLAIAAVCWMTGTMTWLSDQPMPTVVGWWLNFLILTIAAERLELSRVLRVSPLSQITFSILALLLLVGAARGELAASWAPFTAVGLIGLAAWLMRHDIARRTIHQTGQTKFSACSIMAGHIWLAAAGVVLIAAPSDALVLSYDAAVHAIAIGFVFSMLFGHAPIILPVVTGLRIKFSKAAYGPLGLLHLSAFVRVVSDIFGWNDLRAISGILTILALVGYVATLVAVSSRRLNNS